MSDGFVASSAFEPIANSFSTNVFNDPFATATSLDIDNPSPELVKQNIQIVKNQVLHLQNIASNALDGIRNAYHAGANPIDTESNIGNLKQNLESLSELMRQTGLGGLPLLSLTSSPPSEEQMMLDVSQSINVLYARLKKNQESAGVVANLLQQASIVPLRK